MKSEESFDVSSFPFAESRTPNVLITVSFAVSPVTRAVEIRQSSNPSGLKIGASRRPSDASRLSELSETTLNLESKLCRHHIKCFLQEILSLVPHKHEYAFG